MLFITFIYYVCVCVQNICFVVFARWFLFIVYEQFFYCYSVILRRSFSVCVWHLCCVVSLLLLLVFIRISFLLLADVCSAVCVDHNKLHPTVGARGNSIFSHCTEFIVFTIGSPLFVISQACSLFSLLPFVRIWFSDFICEQQQQQQQKTKICYFYRYYYFH